MTIREEKAFGLFSIITISMICAAGVLFGQDQAFTPPVVKGYRMDHCLNWGANCDQTAADFFCRSNGFMRAQSFRVERVRPTLVVVDNTICNDTRCEAFSQISCANGTGSGSGSLNSGVYRLESHNSYKTHRANWNLQVNGNQITGASLFSGEPNVNSLRGWVTGNRVVIERDCTPSWTGQCRQVYDGLLSNGVVRGSFSGTGATPGNSWTLTLGSWSSGDWGSIGGGTPGGGGAAGDLNGAWNYSALCDGKTTWRGTVQLARGADGKFGGTANGGWVNTEQSYVKEGIMRGVDVSFVFQPRSFDFPYSFTGRMSAGRVDGELVATWPNHTTHDNCTFTMSR